MSLCGGCALVCPQKAVSEKKRPVGVVEHGKHQNIDVITGILNTGEVSAVPVMKAAMNAGMHLHDLTLIDCPPGSGCSVMESVMEADCCLLAAEPTAFGFHNFKMVYELVRLLKKPCFVVVNKQDVPYLPLEEFCRQNHTQILLRIPYCKELAGFGASAALASEESPEYRKLFKELLEKIQREAGI